MLHLTIRAIGAMALLYASQAAADPEPDLVLLQGTGTLTAHGTTKKADAILYGATKDTVAFQVPLGKDALGFKGTESEQPTATHYILKVSTVYEGHPGQTENTHIPATGTCEVSLSSDGNVVHSLKCAATTASGPVTLVFSGHRVK